MYITQALAASTPQAVPSNRPLDLLGAYSIPATGRVFMVRGDGTKVLNYDDQYTAVTTDNSRHVFPSIAAALALCVASRGDVVMVLSGHTESIATATAWAIPAGTRIIGNGWGNTRPVVTLTAAASTVTMTAGSLITNVKFVCDGTAATTITQAFNMTGEGASLINCEFHLGTSNTQKCATLLTVSAANCRFVGNKAYADTQATAITNVIVLGTATTGADDFICVGNIVSAALAAATTGIVANISSTATSNRVLIMENFFFNWKSDSSACISLAGNMVTTGLIAENSFRVMDNASVQGIVFSGTGVDVTMDNNRIANDVNETAKQNQGTVSA